MSSSAKKSEMPSSDSGKRRCILVLGMHRSGTSAFTRTLNLLGCDLPGKIMEADKFNERGYWESEDFTSLNDELLAALGSDWADWQQLPENWLQTLNDNRSFVERADELVRVHFSNSNIFVLKDPRICRLADFWIEALKRADIEPLALHPLRDPEDVGKSIERRNGINAKVAELIWLRYTLDAEQASRSLKRIFIALDDLLENPKVVCSEICSSFELEWPTPFEDAESKIAAFLSKSLLTTNRAMSPQTGSTDQLSWSQRLFDILSQAGNKFSTNAKKHVDSLSNAFSGAASSFLPPIEQYHSYAETLQSNVEILTEDLATMRTYAEKTADELSDMRTHAEKMTDEAQISHALLHEAVSLLEMNKAKVDYYQNLPLVRGAARLKKLLQLRK